MISEELKKATAAYVAASNSRKKVLKEKKAIEAELAYAVETQNAAFVELAIRSNLSSNDDARAVPMRDGTVVVRRAGTEFAAEIFDDEGLCIDRDRGDVPA